jgi:5-methylcytosine-specific restriction protein B
MENKMKDLLIVNKNLILTGAPGVGKTYKTAEIAVAVCDGTDKEVTLNRSELMKRYMALVDSGQIAFTTFHQSLDYEEFVEGLKPKITDDKQVTYEVKAGIFKRICEVIDENRIEVIDENRISEEYNKLYSKIENKEIDSLKLKSGKDSKALKISKNGNYISFGNNDIENRISKNIVIKLFNRYPDNKTFEKIDRVEDLRDIIGGDASMYWATLNYIYNQLESKLIKDTKVKKYVLIIDEINRGNISKIFGELITLLEKDKRLGEENEITVTLPYSLKKFGIPSNLYIIGTMNTADRSIGQIDYALRRRFVFVALQSDRSVIENYDKYQGNTKDKAKSLFDRIKTFIAETINEDLDAEDLMIGHSYFLCETEDDLKQRLEHEIIPLIREYEKDGIIMVDKLKLNDKITEWEKL